MKVLLLYPKFPKTFWSYDRFLEMVGLKVFIPSLGILTVAALLPIEWDVRFYDRNVELETDHDWAWCDSVILSAMLAQKADFHTLIQKAVQQGKKVAVGEPYPTSMPEDALDAGAHDLILDEGELTVPQFIQAIATGVEQGVFRSLGKPDVATSPVHRFDLLALDAYLMMSIQFSRGCPFNCKLCDIITLYRRKSRTKEPQQAILELQVLYSLGWRASVFIVDDNFIGNQRNVKRFLQELIPWMEAHHCPFTLVTEASVNLADDSELLDLMVQAGFYGVFLGIETPNQESLQTTRKYQNTRSPLLEACHEITQTGLLIYAGFILGFDGERSGAGDRIRTFVEETHIPQPMLGILQALPNTALWERLQRENRLRRSEEDLFEVEDQNTLMNFQPTRPLDEIVRDYLNTLWMLYEPSNYLNRCFQHCLELTSNPRLRQNLHSPLQKGLRLMAVIWIQGIRRSRIRAQFWRQLWEMLRQRPRSLNLYFGLCAAGEHFAEYRRLARERITHQLGYDPLDPSPLSEQVVTGVTV